MGPGLGCNTCDKLALHQTASPAYSRKARHYCLVVEWLHGAQPYASLASIPQKLPISGLKPL